MQVGVRDAADPLPDPHLIPAVVGCQQVSHHHISHRQGDGGDQRHQGEFAQLSREERVPFWLEVVQRNRASAHQHSRRRDHHQRRHQRQPQQRAFIAAETVAGVIGHHPNHAADDQRQRIAGGIAKALHQRQQQVCPGDTHLHQCDQPHQALIAGVTKQPLTDGGGCQ